MNPTPNMPTGFRGFVRRLLSAARGQSSREAQCQEPHSGVYRIDRAPRVYPMLSEDQAPCLLRPELQPEAQKPPTAEEASFHGLISGQSPEVQQMDSCGGIDSNSKSKVNTLIL